MSNESDGQGRGGNSANAITGESGDLGTIKQLLRQLEEVAARESEAADSALAPTVLATGTPAAIAARQQGLATLQRGSLIVRQPAAAMPEFAPVPNLSAAGATRASKLRGHGWMLAAASFVLGIAAAGGIIVAFDPLKQIVRGPELATQQPAAPASPPSATPSRQTEIARAPAPAAAQPSVGAVTVPASHGAQTPPPPAQLATPAVAPARAIPSADVRYRLTVADRLELRSGERRQLDVAVAPEPEEKARLLVVLRNVPEWLSLSKGGAIGSEIWLLPAHQAGDALIEIAPGATGTADIKVQLASIDGRIISESTLALRVTAPPSPPAMTATAPALPAPLPDTMILRLQARGELLLDTGEVEAARTLFRNAAEAGSVSAALRLAETYDPQEMQRLGMNLGAADPVQAVRWYERAQALGSPVAAARLATLGRR